MTVNNLDSRMRRAINNALRYIQYVIFIATLFIKVVKDTSPSREPSSTLLLEPARKAWVKIMQLGTSAISATRSHVINQKDVSKPWSLLSKH